MRWLITSTSKTLATILVGVLLTVCSLGVLSAHSSDLGQQKASCSASCHSHGHASETVSQDIKDEEDDKDPVPLAATYLQLPVNLSLLYVLPAFGVVWLISNKQRLLLTTQLRF